MFGEQLDIFKQSEESKDDNKEGELKKLKNLERLKQEEKFNYLLTSSIEALSPKDFKIFFPELRDYSQRLAGFKKDYQEFDKNNPQSELTTESAKTNNCEEKLKLYWKIIHPDTQDEVSYQGIATLYLKYKEVVKEIQKRVSKVQKATKESEAKAKTTKENTSENTSVKSSAKLTNEDLLEDNNYPDPYGDIYPYLRELRKGKHH